MFHLFHYHSIMQRKSRHRRVSWSDDGATPTDQDAASPSRSAPPPLRRKQSREMRDEAPGTGTRSGTETDSTLDSVPEESEITE